MRKLVLITSAALGLFACAPLPPQITLQNSFNAADYTWAEADGQNVVTGSALLRTVGGEVRTCGGLTVNLLPDVPYSRERMIAFYGNAGGGYLPANSVRATMIFMNEPFEYSRVGRGATCDAQGNFRFTKVADGAYFVIAEVTWGAPYVGTQGGRIMQRVEVDGGQTVELIMSH